MLRFLLNKSILVGLLACGLSYLLSNRTFADDEAQPKVDAEVERAKAWFDKFDKNVATLKIKPKEADTSYTVLMPPLMRFSIEGNVFGSVYVWEDADQRLAAIGTLGSLPFNSIQTQFTEFHLLKPEPIEPMAFVGIPGKTWSPDVEALAFKSFPTPTPVASNEAWRLVQMRSLARQFSAEMDHRDQKNNLRMLPQPIYRYKNSTQERDGALFALVWTDGTDPEVIVRIEATKGEHGIVWQYQPVRFTYRALRLMHEDKLVWEVGEFHERDRPIQTSPYVTGLMWQEGW
ncbi:hypothetical protein DTL42_18735 [Bremerella cremea]|uniref:Uncharacterized protein n=1 Tax=Bremerella cremea TaxID=1031537 RepID=A0A368KMG4_9BACT|nr:hypothetical protein [Bremerella cremea]RCS43534.1 hypothetical protein DTL42_18735 [Bremerella cremea]